MFSWQLNLHIILQDAGALVVNVGKRPFFGPQGDLTGDSVAALAAGGYHLLTTFFTDLWLYLYLCIALLYLLVHLSVHLLYIYICVYTHTPVVNLGTPVKKLHANAGILDVCFHFRVIAPAIFGSNAHK